MGLLSSLFLAPSRAMHAAPSPGRFEEFHSSPLLKWQQPPLSSSYLYKPAPMTPLSLDPSSCVDPSGKLVRPYYREPYLRSREVYSFIIFFAKGGPRVSLDTSDEIPLFYY